MTRLSLGGSGWRFGAVPRRPQATFDYDEVVEWLPATVPGDVRADLFAAGRIPDPLSDPEAGAWVDDCDWWYARELPTDLPADRRVFIVCEGVDYLSYAYLGRRSLGAAEGMFRRLVYEIPPHLAAGNTFAIRLIGGGGLPRPRLGPRERLLRWLARLGGWGELYPDRLATLKCQMSYGWDFAPRLLTVGLWDDVWLHICDRLRIAWAHVRTLTLAEPATVEVALELDAVTAGKLEATIEVSGETFAWGPLRLALPLAVERGRQRRRLRFQLPERRLWEPWDRGEPNLYRLRIGLRQGGQVLDEWEDTFGLRQVALVRGERQPAGEPGWTFLINGRREFIRGANWVPADALFGRLRPADYRELVDLARRANINMLRVWGGGLREKRAFYAACDRAGILVWQEFPLACAFLDDYPQDQRFLHLAAREAAGIVKALRNHPSLVLWCGGNEINPRRSRRLVATLAAAVAVHDGDRPFRPASPGPGDRHYWRVWHGGANVGDYRKTEAGFVSEFGLQAPPDEASLRRYLAPQELWPPGAAWQRRCAQLAKLARYARPLRPGTLAAFIAAGQRAQAAALQIAIEHWRRHKGRTGGMLVWQFNEPWPAITWSIIDYYRRPKLAYERLRQSYAPLLVCLDYPLRPYAPGDLFTATLWALNDLAEAREGCELRVRQGGREVERRALSFPADSCRPIGELRLRLAAPLDLALEVWRESSLVGGNTYDLEYYDSQQWSPLDALRAWFVEWTLR